MRLSKYRTISIVDVVVACLACTAYGIALFSTAIGGFWTGPDFDHPPMSGLNCLLSGWFHFPIGWLANPVMFTAVVLLLARCRSAAFLSATGAIGLAWLWTHEFCQQFPAKLLMAGYHWWLLSMLVLVVGSLCSLVFHYRETWQSWRSLSRICQELPSNVQRTG
jgi:hypothetical protein